MPVSIIDRIRQADNLPSLPSVAIQVLKMTQADDLSVSDIAREIQKDPAVTSKILRVVNSSMFGMSRKISSLQQAMVVLGLRTVKVMVLSFSLVDMMANKQKERGFDYGMYWRRSLTTAVVARLLADATQRSLADEAFVGGLLCDLSMLAAAHCALDLYEPVVKAYRMGNGTVQEIEQQVLGLTHEEITGDLLDHWGLPEDLCEAVRTHHQAIEAPFEGNANTATLVKILRAASLLADVFVADAQAGEIDQRRQQIMFCLKIDETALTALLEKIDKNVREAASAFALNIGQTLSYQEIQAGAAMQLARLSMAAELERAETAQREKEAQLKVQQLHTQNIQLHQQASTDALTGIANRGSLEQQLVTECDRCRRDLLPIGVILLDLDRFKKLNDTFGHQTGDETLRQVGGVLKQVSTETQFPARYGGEEFAIIVSNVTARELRALAEDVRLGIAKLRIPCGNRYIPVTASFGAAHVSAGDPALQPTELLKRADRCLYAAKNNGRNRVVCIDSRQAAALASRQLVRI